MDRPRKPGVADQAPAPIISIDPDRTPRRQPRPKKPWWISWQFIAVSLLMLAFAAGNYIVLSQRVRNMEKWQAEEKALESLKINGSGVKIVREPVIPAWLCTHPDHAKRVVEIRFSEATKSETRPGRGSKGPEGLMISRDWAWEVHNVDRPQMSPAQLKIARSELPYLRKITAGKKVLLSR